jgi:hypothetical protein
LPKILTAAEAPKSRSATVMRAASSALVPLL